MWAGGAVMRDQVAGGAVQVLFEDRQLICRRGGHVVARTERTSLLGWKSVNSDKRRADERSRARDQGRYCSSAHVVTAGLRWVCPLEDNNQVAGMRRRREIWRALDEYLADLVCDGFLQELASALPVSLFCLGQFASGLVLTMELWNDFEGKTVAGRFPLERLLGPQGRSAFFATTANGSGSAVIRLIETHFDEEEILSRWRTVMGLQQPHLQALTVCGETTLDGTKLVYAVLELTDMELSDALRERPLMVAETRQVTTAVLGALETLHGAGLVHEHVEAAYVLAQGETVKLRSDCVREAPEEGGEAARSADVRGLALLIAECLTQARDESRAATLPAPFAEMVRRGANGDWGLAEMRSTLESPVLVRPGSTGTSAGMSARPTAAVIGASAAQPSAAAQVAVSPSARVAVPPAARGLATASSAVVSAVAPAMASAGRVAEEHSPAAVAAVSASMAEPRVGATLPRRDAEAGRVDRVGDSDRIVLEPVEDEGRRNGLWAGLGVAAVLVFGWLGWHVTHGAPAAPAAVNAPSVAGSAAEPAIVRPTPVLPKSSAAIPARGSAASPARGSAAAVAARSSSGLTAARGETTGGRGSWRVVAFTYNREDQARHKAEQIAARHAALRPEAWSPSGRGPWLVSLGGWMDQREAEGTVSRAKRDGLPRDTFARNYRR